MTTTSAAAQPTPEHILQVGLAFWASKTLLSAIELEVFTELAKRPLLLAELQGRLGLHPRSARDFFDTLVATGFLERNESTYRNTSATDLYLDKRKPTYIGGMLEMCNRRLYPFWSHLTEALRTGRPQNEARDGSMPLFEALYAEPAALKEFLRAMTGLSRVQMKPSRSCSLGPYIATLRTSARHRGISRFRLQRITPTCKALVSTCLRLLRFSRNMRRKVGLPGGFAFNPEISLRTRSRRSM